MITQDRDQNKKKSVTWQVIALIVTLLLAGTDFSWLIGIVLGIALVLSPILIPLIIHLRRKKHRAKHQSALEDTTFTTCSRQEAFDKGTRKLFCFHDDKGIHHVSRGKEIDPWDRPDIDISKYQRKD